MSPQLPDKERVQAMREQRTGQSERLVLLAVFLVMLALNFMTPMLADDFAHYYDIDGGGHIDTVREIVRNLGYLRRNVNGRIFPHFCVYLMQIPPRAVFRVLNAAVLPLLLWQMSRFLPRGRRPGAAWLLAGAALLWIFMPAFGEVFLWLTGSCNYGWGLLLFLPPLRAFHSRCTAGKDRDGIPKTVLLLLVSFLAGAWSESGAIALLSAEFFLLVLTVLRERRLPLRQILLFLAACAGFVFLLLTPATLPTRTGDLSLHALAVGLKGIVARLREDFLWLYILYAALFGLRWSRGGDRWTLLASLALVAAGLLSAAALAAASNIAMRSFFALGAFTVLACLLLLAGSDGEEERGLRAALAGVLLAVFLFSFASGAGDILSVFMQSRERAAVVRAAQTSGERSVTLREYAVTTKYGPLVDEDLREDPDYWYNDLLAHYYGFDEVRGVPAAE